MDSQPSLTLERIKNSKPMNNNVLIEIITKKEHKTTSGIVIPSSGDKEQFLMGQVIKVGPGKTNDKGEKLPITEVKPGEYVLINQYTGMKIHFTDSGKEHTFIVASVDDLKLGF